MKDLINKLEELKRFNASKKYDDGVNDCINIVKKELKQVLIGYCKYILDECTEDDIVTIDEYLKNDEVGFFQSTKGELNKKIMGV